MCGKISLRHTNVENILMLLHFLSYMQAWYELKIG